MTQKIKVGAVSYLNTKPLIYGFQQGLMKTEVELLIDYPSKIASWLQHGQIDIGLVPIAIIPTLKEYYLVSDYGIGCDGEVASVCLFSEVPLAEIKTILLDYQSRTSVALLKVLLREYWGISPVLIAATENYEQQITGTTAGLVIGDRALEQRDQSKYTYDLGLAWKEMTGLPFVFAAWISNRPIDEDFVSRFEKAVYTGFNHLPEIARSHNSSFDLLNYYTNCISYRLDDQKKKGLDLFLKKMEMDTGH